jgi:hypothetical protein
LGEKIYMAQINKNQPTEIEGTNKSAEETVRITQHGRFTVACGSLESAFKCVREQELLPKTIGSIEVDGTPEHWTLRIRPR